jgi:hypothetical protein
MQERHKLEHRNEDVSTKTSRIAASNVLHPRTDKAEVCPCIQITRVTKPFCMFPSPLLL